MREMVIELPSIARQTDAPVVSVVAKKWQQMPLQRRWAWVALLPVLAVLGFFLRQAWREPESAEPLRAVPLTTLALPLSHKLFGANLMSPPSP